MRIEMRGSRHLDIWLAHPSKDPREVIIDAERDVRITDHKSIVKVRFDSSGNILDVLVDDVPVWRRE